MRNTTRLVSFGSEQNYKKKKIADKKDNAHDSSIQYKRVMWYVGVAVGGGGGYYFKVDTKLYEVRGQEVICFVEEDIRGQLFTSVEE